MSELADLLDAQDGHFVWADALRAGVTRRELNAALRRGELAHVGRCAYIDARRLTPAQRHRRRTVAMLRAQGGRIATHHSAATLLGLPVQGAALDTVHFGRVTTSGRRGPSWVLHRLPEGIATTSVGLEGLAVPTVTPAVAAVQCAMLAGPRSGLVTIDAVLRQGEKAIGLAALEATFDGALTAYARTPRVETARTALALGDPRRESPAESLAAYELHMLHIGVTPQWPITVGRERFRVDFRVDGTNVVIEVDGEGKYADPEERTKEKRREQLLRGIGYDVVRLTWEDLGNRAKIRALVGLAIQRCAGRPLLP